jgi:thiamine biosynthesis lipoprotein
MGTTYTVKVFPESAFLPADLAANLRHRLDALNRSMSTFLPTSEISRFNALRETDKGFSISKDFQKVFETAAFVHRITDGAWDGTVKPLVDLWGFGAPGEKIEPPAPERIRDALKTIGLDHIRISGKGELVKKKADVTLDLASIAKGYGVDRLAAVLKDAGIRNFLVEIGGEVYASGQKPGGHPWRIGINAPRPDAPLDRVYKVVPLKDMALATSGDYRNFFELGRRRYSHVIDPRTGYPVQNGVVSASVLAETCTLADALATALMVMGPEKGCALVNRLESVECLILVQKNDAPLQEFFSNGFYATASD